MHPYFLRYYDQLGRFSKEHDALAFLTMVKLREGKLKWALRQKGLRNSELATVCGIKVRRLQQLRAEYRKTGEIPMLNPKRRPGTGLAEGDKELIREAVRESRLDSAVHLRLYLRKQHGLTLPMGKLHRFLLREGMARPDPKKQKQRKYCRYERTHSFSLGHMDWHESRAVPGKQVITWEDDASRLILAGGEFDEATTAHAISVVKEAKRAAWDGYSAILRELNTDQGTQFYGNSWDKRGKRVLSEFERFLIAQGIRHIPSRRNHPQTNGKNERWFRTYEEKRGQFSSFEALLEWYNGRIHLGLSRTEGITPKEAAINKLRAECLLGLFYRRVI